MLAILLPLAALPAAPGPLPPEPGLAYDIEARYDAETGSIDGTEQIRWENRTATPAAELRFHLYLNAFAHPQTTWMREARLRRPERAKRRGRDWGGIDVLGITGPGGEDWTGRLYYDAPDDGNPHDRTVAVLPLPEPLAPGGALEIRVAFRSRLPGIWARTGRAGQYVAAAQWFPKLGVFEPPSGDPGAEARWNCPQFHAFTEFYADFARYRVTLTLPEIYRGKVAATGEPVGESDAGATGEFRVEYRAGPVHDFAWFADPRFHVVERARSAGERADARRDARWRARLGPDAPDGPFELPPVRVRVYLQPSHRHLAERHLRAAEHALDWFSRAFGPYPYPSLSVVDPPPDGRGSGGMEYPTLITAGARLFTPAGRLSPEGVIVHEVGHQWFYGLLANDEFEHAFLDEGFNTFAESTALADGYGGDEAVQRFGPLQIPGEPVFSPSAGPAPLGPLGAIASGRAFGAGPGRLAHWFLAPPPLVAERRRRAFPWPERRQWLPVAGLDVVRRTGWTYADGETWRHHTYRLTALTLEAYRRAAGDRALWGALRRYATRFRFRHPRPDDFIDAAEELAREGAAGEAQGGMPSPPDPRRYFEQVWSRPGAADFAVGPVTCAPEPPPEPIAADDERDATGDEEVTCRVVVRQLGRWRLPVEIELRFDDGTVECVTWDGRGAWTAIERTGRARLDAVRVDPERRWVFETDLTNNEWSAKGRRREGLRLLLSAFHALAERLLALGNLG